ncbi:MAG TPA: cyclic nucleotide-binding domain-containing protein [Candidatus Deferrimicrobiaceae bacterium]|nr:cyclic nucleotide-binding domain-containing protein [Candidatus Deferrimicrobiaceae bacterium]
MNEGLLGREYADGEVICREGDPGDRMYVIQAGRAAVWRQEGGVDIKIGELQSGDVFGEMSIIDRKPRSATVCAKGRARVLTLDKRAFLRGVHEDPSLAYRVLQAMSQRIRRRDEELSLLKRCPALAGGPSWVLLVVSRDHPELCDDLLRKYPPASGVQVFLDRRLVERRQRIEPHHAERRHADRRRPPQGWTLHLAQR